MRINVQFHNTHLCNNPIRVSALCNKFEKKLALERTIKFKLFDLSLNHHTDKPTHTVIIIKFQEKFL